MSESSTVASGDQKNASPSGASTEASGQSNQDNPNNQVSYETYQKTLAQRKADQEKLRSLEEKLNSLENEKLEAEGDKDKLIESLKNQLKDSRDKLTTKQKTYADKALRSQIELKAKEFGCIDTDVLYKTMDLDKLTIDLVNDDLQVDQDGLKDQLESLRKDKSYLFSASAPKIRDGNPVKETIADTKEKSFADMSLDELKSQAIGKAGLNVNEK